MSWRELEVDLSRELHAACVVQELLLRVIEEGIGDGLEGVAASEAGTVDVVDGTGCVLGVVEDVERLCAELERVTLEERDALVGGEVEVVDGANRQRVTGRSRQRTGTGLNVVGVRVDGGVTDEISVASGRCRGSDTAVGKEGGIVDGVTPDPMERSPVELIMTRSMAAPLSPLRLELTPESTVAYSGDSYV